MGYTEEGTQALIERKLSEAEGFACPHCSKVFESEQKRDVCHASHFEGTDNISRPKGDRRRSKKNIVEKWKKG
jgi:hypothetical protein